MDNRDRFRAAILVPVLLAVLAGPAWGAPAGTKPSHYPGQDCSGCHKVRGKSTGKMPAKSTPATPATGTVPAATPSGATPAKGAPQPR